MVANTGKRYFWRTRRHGPRCNSLVVMSLGAVPGHVAGWTRGAIPPSSAVLIQRACLEHRICESTHKGKLQEKVPEAFS